MNAPSTSAWPPRTAEKAEMLLGLVERMERQGARVQLTKDGLGRIVGLTVEGAQGIGPCLMSPIRAAETLSDWLERREMVASYAAPPVRVRVEPETVQVQGQRRATGHHRVVEEDGRWVATARNLPIAQILANELDTAHRALRGSEVRQLREENRQLRAALGLAERD